MNPGGSQGKCRGMSAPARTVALPEHSCEHSLPGGSASSL